MMALMFDWWEMLDLNDLHEFSYISVFPLKDSFILLDVLTVKKAKLWLYLILRNILIVKGIL